MTAPVAIALLGEPVGKGRPRIGRLRDGRAIAFTPQATRSYETALKVAATEAMRGRVPFDGPVSLVLIARFPVPQSWSGRKQGAALRGEIMPTGRPDLDNILKIVGDSLNEIVWRDDRQIVRSEMTKRYGAQPGVEIIVMPYEPAPAPVHAQPPLVDAPLFATVAA